MLDQCEEVIEHGLTPAPAPHLPPEAPAPAVDPQRSRGALGKSEDAIKANLYRMRRALAAGAPGLETLLQG